MLRVSNNIFYKLAFICLVIFPIASVSLYSVHGVVNLLVALAGVYLWYCYKVRLDYSDKAEVFFIASVLFIFFVVCLVSFVAGIDEVALKKIGKFFYLLLVVPVYLFFRSIQISQSAFWYGLALGAFTSLFVALYDVMFSAGRAHGISNPIIFGDLSLLLGSMCLAGLGWFRKKDVNWFKFLPILAALMGGLASLLSQSRGGWLAAPVVLALFIWVYGKNVSKKELLIGFVLMSVALYGIYQVPQSGVASKVHTTLVNVEQYFNTDVLHPSHGTSIGSRLEAWQASWDIFLSHPFFGVGWGGFQEHAQVLVDKGLRHQSAAKYSHPHNQFLSSLVSGGLFGFIATVALFFVPILIFYRVIKSQGHSDNVKNIALAGLILVVSFAIFNLSESFLERSRPVGFFIFYLAVCMAGIREEKKVDG